MSSVARDTGRDSVGKGKAPSRLDGPAARARAGGDTRRLPGTAPLTLQGDLAEQMVAGIDRFLARQLKAVVGRRPGRWQRDVASPEAYERSVEANRKRLLKIVGLLDQREEVQMQLLATHRQPALVGEGPGYRIERVRWNVFRGIEGEGLLLEPSGPAVANIVALPDCDWTPEAACGLEPGVPEEAQFPRRLAENGCRVVVPVLIDRHDTYSGIDGVRMTNLPHREFVYRAAYELGRHIIGYEVQKVLAAAGLAAPRARPAAARRLWLRRGRARRVVCRGGGSKDPGCRSLRVLRPPGDAVAAAHLPQHLVAANRVRRRRDREPHSASLSGGGGLPAPGGGRAAGSLTGPGGQRGARNHRHAGRHVGGTGVRARSAARGRASPRP